MLCCNTSEFLGLKFKSDNIAYFCLLCNFSCIFQRNFQYVICNIFFRLNYGLFLIKMIFSCLSVNFDNTVLIVSEMLLHGFNKHGGVGGGNIARGIIYHDLVVIIFRVGKRYKVAAKSHVRIA